MIPLKLVGRTLQGGWQFTFQCDHVLEVSATQMNNLPTEASYFGYLNSLRCGVCDRHAQSFLFDAYLR